MRFSINSLAPLTEMQMKCSCDLSAMSASKGRTSAALSIFMVSLSKYRRASSKAERILAACQHASIALTATRAVAENYRHSDGWRSPLPGLELELEKFIFGPVQ